MLPPGGIITTLSYFFPLFYDLTSAVFVSGFTKPAPADATDKSKPAKKRKHYSTADISSLDTIFSSTNGHPSDNVIKRTAETLGCTEDQVNLTEVPLPDLYLITAKTPVKFPVKRTSFFQYRFDTHSPSGLYLTTFRSLSINQAALVLWDSCCE